MNFCAYREREKNIGQPEIPFSRILFHALSFRPIMLLILRAACHGRPCLAVCVGRLSVPSGFEGVFFAPGSFSLLRVALE